MDADALIHKAMHQRGPGPGEGRSHGTPWRGIVEETPHIYVTWLVQGAKAMGRPIPSAIYIDGKRVDIVSVELTFGARYYFLAPCCGRRTEALYFLGDEVGCRKCLHLGYRSQAHRPGSVWAYLAMAFDKSSPWQRFDWPENVVMTEIVAPVRERLASELEAMLSRVSLEADDVD